jgi:hypothetical protein
MPDAPHRVPGLAGDAPRRAYRTPHLRDFGHLQEVTKTDTSGPSYDGGSPSSVYAS